MKKVSVCLCQVKGHGSKENIKTWFSPQERWWRIFDDGEIESRVGEAGRGSDAVMQPLCPFGVKKTSKLNFSRRIFLSGFRTMRNRVWVKGCQADFCTSEIQKFREVQAIRRSFEKYIKVKYIFVMQDIDTNFRYVESNRWMLLLGAIF